VTPLRRSRLAIAIAVVAVLALLAAALLLVRGGSDPEPAASPPPAPEPAEEPPPAPEPVDPLTGLAPAPETPLLAVKIDNGPLSRPFHRGLEASSIVYLELVEGGATRLLAMYSQAPDLEIGPIRSLRESDIEILLQYGKPALAFTGANPGVLATFREVVSAGGLIEVSYENRPDLYRLGERRRDARNFFASPAALAANAPGAEPAREMGFTFDENPRPDAQPAGGARVVYSDRETWDVAYDPAVGRYSILQNGVPLAGVAPVNVVVQQVEVQASGYRDVTGAVTPYTVSVGGGPLAVMRDGGVVGGQWQRPDPASGTSLIADDGTPIALKPGPTWVLLQPMGLPFTPS
jgi:hypothetical protein